MADGQKPDIEVLRQVGKASRDMLMEAKKLVVAGAKLVDVADTIEAMARSKGYTPAFPLNLSINNEAAHYAPTLNDQKTFKHDDIVKIDFGVAKDGVLGDCAVTVALAHQEHKMVQAVEEALGNAIAEVKAGVEVSKIGRVIGETIEARGFKPIKNLGGHGVEMHALHAGLFIPNYDNGDATKLEEGMTIAIEPFATNGKGVVRDSDTCEIFEFVGEVPVRLPEARTALAEIQAKYNKEPFAARWLSNVLGSRFKLYAAINELARIGAIERDPMLVEAGNGIVTQAEATVLVQKDGCEVLTKS